MAFDRVGRIRFGSDLNAEDMGAEYGLDLNSAYQINNQLPKAPTKCRIVSTFHTLHHRSYSAHALVVHFFEFSFVRRLRTPECGSGLRSFLEPTDFF
ncbi:unnamed protein product [Anisakis simplex]|uniref:Uncharacterized protein n=1 Tax=Anisakis simplex TaxID=6269 RepID=A0A0M3JQ25_ANISI|nr:unnamed protein product [Anisakis simplex]